MTSKSPPEEPTVARRRHDAEQSSSLSLVLLGIVGLLAALSLYWLRTSGRELVFGSDTAIKRPDTRAIWEAAGKPMIELTPEELAKFDGTDPSKPIYLAILGEVFDVTQGASFYAKPDGGYAFFSGVDASRAYATGCFETHLTHDIRGLTEKQIKSIQQWADFYRNSKKYFKVGTVRNPSIAPDEPIPEDCTGKKK